MFKPRPLLLVVMCCLAGLALSACDDNAVQIPEPPQTTTDPQATLAFRGRQHKLPLEHLRVFLTNVDPAEKDRYPETFALRGPNLLLVGSIPPSMSVGSDGQFSRLRGQVLTLARVGGETGDREGFIQLGVEPMRVVGGTLMIDKVDPAPGFYTPVEGRFTIQAETESGPATLEGTFKVDAATVG